MPSRRSRTNSASFKRARRSRLALVAIAGPLSNFLLAGTLLTRDLAITTIRKQGPNPIVFEIERDGKPLEITVTPEGAVGSSIVGMDISGAEFVRVDPTLPQAFRMSLLQNWDNSKLIGRTLRGLDQRLFASRSFDPGAGKRALEIAIGCRIGDHCMTSAYIAGDLTQRSGIATRADRLHAIAFRLTLDQIDGACADRAGRAKDGNRPDVDGRLNF